MATIYSDRMEVAFAGMKADSGDDRVESYPAGVAVPFGRVVGINPAAMGQASPVDNPIAYLPAAIANFKPVGAAVHSHTAAAANLPTDGYAQYDCLSVMTRGLMWVEAAAATALALNSTLQFNAAGQAVVSAGTLFPGAIVRSPVVALADGKYIVCVEFHSPRYVAPAA